MKTIEPMDSQRQEQSCRPTELKPSEHDTLGSIAGIDRSLYGRCRKRRIELPAPAGYYQQRFKVHPHASGWVSVPCPFHDDQTPSLSVNLDHGGFICHGCGAKGGNIAAFEALSTGESWVAAAKRLAGDGGAV